MRKPERDCLWIILFFIVFINGFEAGGYQASLWSVEKDFDLSMSSMGLFAAMELFATMLAPILLGRWADGVEKLKGIPLDFRPCFIPQREQYRHAKTGLCVESEIFAERTHGCTTGGL